jgi:c-di-GMP-binding flagellar brake protein YcgR
MDVNVCGDGIRFLPYRPLSLGDRIDLRMVLPPFIVVEARGEVIQVRPDSTGLDPAHTVVVRFVDIAENEREKIVRYALQRQAEMQRRRQRAPA